MTRDTTLTPLALLSVLLRKPPPAGLCRAPPSKSLLKKAPSLSPCLDLSAGDDNNKAVSQTVKNAVTVKLIFQFMDCFSSFLPSEILGLFCFYLNRIAKGDRRCVGERDWDLSRLRTWVPLRPVHVGNATASVLFLSVYFVLCGVTQYEIRHFTHPLRTSPAR